MDSETGARRTGLPWLFIAAAFWVGLSVGVEVTALLAAKSHRAFLETSRLLFTTEEDLLLQDALRSQDIESALLHAGTRLEASHGSAYETAFGPARPDWTLTWSLSEILSGRRMSAETANLSEARYRAHLAVLWEKLGNKEAAAREYARIAQLTGKDDPSKWRILAEKELNARARATK